jgi:predicted alpha/beta hydrolase family esterase
MLCQTMRAILLVQYGPGHTHEKGSEVASTVHYRRYSLRAKSRMVYCRPHKWICPQLDHPSAAVERAVKKASTE